MDSMAMLSEEQAVADYLGHQVGDHYIIHGQTSKILDNINKRLNEEDKTLRTYRRALAFSQMIQKDLVPILKNSNDNIEVFDAVIRLLVNLTVPVECLCPLEVLSKSDVGRQTIYELSSSLARTKQVFKDRLSTRVIMDQLLGFSSKKKGCSSQEVTMVNNCLLLIRNILHIPDNPSGGSLQGGSNKNIRGCSVQNQIMWNLFAQNMDTVLIDLIKHKNSAIWCTSVVQMIALVYKDQHVITLQLLQNFLESGLSESSEDNESNTSPQYQYQRSGEPTTDDSSDQTSREGSSPCVGSGIRDDILTRRESCGSLEVLPTNSPAPSTFPPSPGAIPSLMSPASPSDLTPTSQPCKFVKNNQNDANDNNKDEAAEKRGDNTSSGIESEIYSTNENEPPNKLYVVENEKGEKTVHGRQNPQVEQEFVHKSRGGPAGQSGQFSRIFGKSKTGGGSGSDSSGATGVPKALKMTNGDASDYGYMTGHVEKNKEQVQQEMVSSSSNEDDSIVRGGKRNAPPRTNPVKPRAKTDTGSKLTPAEIKGKHRSKLLKRSKENRMRVKAMVNHVPTDKDISELLKEFTVDFLHSGYSSLVAELLEKFSKNDSDISMDKSHFLWLLTYFLKFASQLEIGLDEIGTVISFRTLSYITYEGVELLETLELANRERRTDVNPHLRRMHLVVTALREFIQTIALYNEIQNLSLCDRQHLEVLQQQTVNTPEVRQLLVLLLRRFNPAIQSLQYLSDLIVTNHMLLLNLETTSSSKSNKGPVFDMSRHVMQFANPELMRQYGRLLEEFEQNSPFVNDCIFTVMHHIAGDLDSPQTLYMPSILKSFSKIWEQGLQICDDWVDLIEYIIQQFIQSMGSSPHTCAANMVECLDYTEVIHDESGLTGAQTGQLFWHFTQVENRKDPVGAIIEIYKQTDNLVLSRLAVIQALLSHGIITHAQYMNFIYMKNVMGSQCKIEHEGSVIAEVGSEHCSSDGHIIENAESDENYGQLDNRNSEIQVLKDCLTKLGRESLISWLQEVLLGACRVKMYPTTLVPLDSDLPHDPVPFYYNKAGQSIPLVPWNRAQFQGLQTEAFIMMLHKLGFHLPADVGKVFPRIPHFWSADHIFTVASRLGPIDKSSLKFSLEELERLSTKVETETISRPGAMDKDPMDEMDMMGSGLEMMDLLEEPTTGGNSLPPNAGSWLQMAMSSKQMNSPQSIIRSSPERDFNIPDMDAEYMDMD